MPNVATLHFTLKGAGNDFWASWQLLIFFLMMIFSEVEALQRHFILIWAGNEGTSPSENTLRNTENTLECVSFMHKHVQCCHRHVGYFIWYIYTQRHIYTSEHTALSPQVPVDNFLIFSWICELNNFFGENYRLLTQTKLFLSLTKRVKRLYLWQNPYMHFYRTTLQSLFFRTTSIA